MPITAEELVALGWDTMVPDTINGRVMVIIELLIIQTIPMVLALKRWSMRRAVRLSRLKLGLDQPSILSQQGAFGVTNPLSGMMKFLEKY